MGAWSHEPFGNDTACDWSYGLLELSDLSHIEAALDKVLAVGSEYLEAPDAEEAIAAMEVLAKLCGKGTQVDIYTEDVDAWVKKVAILPPPPLLKKAQAALKRVLSSNSELLELWQEGEESAEWKESMEKLGAALGA
jgi:hypothetical protein